MLDIVDNGKFIELNFNAPAYAPNAIPLESFRRTSNYTFKDFIGELKIYANNFGMFDIIKSKWMINDYGDILTDEDFIEFDKSKLSDYYDELKRFIYSEKLYLGLPIDINSKVLKVHIKLLKPLFYTIPIESKSKPKRKYRKRTGIPRGIKNEVFKRDGYRCVQCGAKKGDEKPDGTKVVIHCDHIKPIDKGGTDEMSNLQTLCADCNLNKNNVYQKIR